MSDLSAQNIAYFLQEHPDFFTDHADVFAMLSVPHPYQNRAISLGERQVMTLRDKVRTLEQGLADLIHQAKRNEAISTQIKRWCQCMLAEPDVRCLPDAITRTLMAQFDLQAVALRLWSQPDAAQAEWAAPVSRDVRVFADALHTPYCAPQRDQGNNLCGEEQSDRNTPAALAEVLTWLTQPPASAAVVALRTQAEAPAFGLLVLGADDLERFAPDMATDFLHDIAQLASATLGRLTGT